MMTNYNHDSNFAKTRQERIQADMENQHRAREAQKNKKNRRNNNLHDENAVPFYAPALARTGDAMVKAGEWLQKRYDATARQIAEDVSQITEGGKPESAAPC
jgi:hypothetical protein